MRFQQKFRFYGSETRPNKDLAQAVEFRVGQGTRFRQTQKRNTFSDRVSQTCRLGNQFGLVVA